MKHAKNNSSLLFLFVFLLFLFSIASSSSNLQDKRLGQKRQNCDYALYLAICLWLWCFFRCSCSSSCSCCCCCCFRFLYCCWVVFTISDFYFKISMQRHFYFIFLLIDRRRDRKKFAFEVVFLCFFCVVFVHTRKIAYVQSYHATIVRADWKRY